MAATTDPEVRTVLGMTGMTSKQLGDVASLSFEVTSSIPAYLEMEYVLGSQEYTYTPSMTNNMVNRYCDVLVMSVKAPSNTVGKQISVVPGTQLPVSVMSINNRTSPELYLGMRPPASGATSAAAPVEGMTTLLRTKRYTIAAGVPYTIKIFLADGYNKTLDTMIWIKSGSFMHPGMALTLITWVLQ